jgi:tripartite-type tricarboxylate transporter receptor subunit TctC
MLLGASGSIAAGRVARAKADGYTLSIGSLGTHVFNGALYTFTYDLMNDLEAVSLLVTQPRVIMARKDMPANDLRELIAWLKANPDKASQGTPGVASLNHIAGVLFQNIDRRPRATPMMRSAIAEARSKQRRCGMLLRSGSRTAG